MQMLMSLISTMIRWPSNAACTACVIILRQIVVYCMHQHNYRYLLPKVNYYRTAVLFHLLCGNFTQADTLN